MTHLNWPLLSTAIFPWATLAITALFTPRLSRPDLFFAVTVQPSFRQSLDGRKILRRYDRAVLFVAFLALLLIYFTQFESSRLLLLGLLGPIYLELAGWLVAFLAARSQARRFHFEPSTQREAAMEPHDVSMVGGLIAQSGPFLILLAVMAVLAAGWDKIPARIPIHWGVAGQPDGWGHKSFASVFGCACLGMLICALIVAMWYATIHGARRIYSSGPNALRQARYVRLVSYFLLGTEYWLALLMGSISLLALRSNPSGRLPLLGPILLGQAILVGSIFLIVYRTGQGGWRLRSLGEKDATADAQPIGDRTPDECWKLGMFYFNPDDPALFVEKRFGIGWTVNFSNPRAWVVLGGVLGFVAIALLIATLAGR